MKLISVNYTITVIHIGSTSKEKGGVVTALDQAIFGKIASGNKAVSWTVIERTNMFQSSVTSFILSDKTPQQPYSLTIIFV